MPPRADAQAPGGDWLVVEVNAFDDAHAVITASPREQADSPRFHHRLPNVLARLRPAVKQLAARHSDCGVCGVIQDCDMPNAISIAVPNALADSWSGLLAEQFGASLEEAS